jgi:hypothetical protein
VDTGSAVRSRKAARRSGRTALERNALVIDRFFETKQQALGWARRNPVFMLVRVSPPDFRPSRFSRTRALPPNSRQRQVPSTQSAAPVTVEERQKSWRYAR